LTADLIISSYNIMGCDAFSVGAYDLSLGIDYLMHKKVEAKFPFISANLSDKHEKLLLPPYVIKQVGPIKIAVFGLIDSTLKVDKVPENHKSWSKTRSRPPRRWSRR